MLRHRRPTSKWHAGDGETAGVTRPDRRQPRLFARSRLHEGSFPWTSITSFIEGEERLRADRAACDSSRAVHVALAEMFRDRIDFKRRTVMAEARSRR
jgi:hypothetical protein